MVTLEQLQRPHILEDDELWQMPPYIRKRPLERRLRLAAIIFGKKATLRFAILSAVIFTAGAVEEDVHNWNLHLSISHITMGGVVAHLQGVLEAHLGLPQLLQELSLEILELAREDVFALCRGAALSSQHIQEN